MAFGCRQCSDSHRTSSDTDLCSRLMPDCCSVGIGRCRHSFGSYSVAGCLVYLHLGVAPFHFESMRKRMLADLNEIDEVDSLLVHYPVGIDFALNQLD